MQFPKNSVFSVLFILPLLAFTQDRLSLEEAVAIALKNNYGVLIANTQVTIDSANATKGNAGFWPVIAAEAGVDYGNTFFSGQSFSSGPDQEETLAQSWGAGAALQMDWTIFDGKRMFATYDRLKAMSDKSRLELKAEMEAIVANVYDAYYAVVYRQSLIDALDKNMLLYAERETLARRRWELGSASKLDFLQASLDLKEQQSHKLRLQVDLDDAKATLNTYLARPPETSFAPADIFLVPVLPDWSEVVSRAANNREVAVLSQQIRLGELQVKEAEAARKPTITWSNRLSYGYDQNQAGFLQKSQQAAYATGLTLRWQIFDGKNVQRNIQQAKLQVQQYKLVVEDNRLQVQWLALQSLNRLKNALEQLKFEEESRAVAEEAIKVATERYRVGNGTALELREIQSSYNDLQTRIVEAQYRASAAYTGLKFLQGVLVEK